MTNFEPCVDGSEHQGNWIVSKAKAAGIRMFYTRGLFGTKKDERCGENCRRFQLNGVQYGIYIWFRPIKSVTAQANALIKLHKDTKALLVPMLDIEDSSRLPAIVVRARVKQMVELVTEGIGKPPVIYTGYPFWIKNVKSTDPYFARCPLWLSRYPVNSVSGYERWPVPKNPAKWDEYAFSFNRDPIVPAPWKIWCAWQFSAGYNGCGPKYGASSDDLDLNIVRVGQLDRFRLP